MMEALKEECVIEKLQEKGYEQGIYVYGMTEPSVSVAAVALFGVFAGNQPKPFILNFSEKGIAFLELNSMCSAYTGLHNFVAANSIETILFSKGFLINTLTIQTTDGIKQKIKISNVTAGASWQKDNVKKMIGFIQTYKK
ncbi:hypothetical protein FACS1894190_18140 [Spirochaetia bacterium]|nr:hypothetical protein FACS1894190_18140 [Spirochaetia bacterium]